MIDFKHLRANKDRVSAAEYNRLVDIVSQMANSLMACGFYSPSTGFLQRRYGRAAGVEGRLFVVQSAAAGWAVYNCKEYLIDASNWSAGSGADNAKITKKDDDLVEVLNLAEFDPEENLWSPHLAPGDLIFAWYLSDDEGTKRWAGVPFIERNFERLRIAYCTENAPENQDTITCRLDRDNDSATEITVHCSIIGDDGSGLAEALPHLNSGDRIYVRRIVAWNSDQEAYEHQWHCVTIFQHVDICPLG